MYFKFFFLLFFLINQSGEEIFDAILKGDLKQVKTLAANKQNIELKAMNYFWFTPLLFSIENDKDEISEYLVLNGADLKVSDNKFYISALNLAAAKGKEKLLKLIFSNGKDNLKKSDIKKAINFAVSNGNFETFNFLRSKISRTDLEFNNPSFLCFAIFGGNKEIIEYLSSLYRNINNIICPYMWSPLHYAVYSSNMGIIDFFLSKGADINAKDNKLRTPLHIAALYSSEEIYNYLISKGANEDLKDLRGKNARDYLLLKRKIENKIENVCPFECCTYGEALSEIPLIAYKNEGSRKEVAFKINALEIFKALKGDILIYKKGKGIVKEDNEELKKGTKVEILDYYWEGIKFYNIMLNGRIYNLTEDQMNVIEYPYSDWWIIIENKKGEKGWIVIPQDEGFEDEHYDLIKINGIDLCG